MNGASPRARASVNGGLLVGAAVGLLLAVSCQSPLPASEAAVAPGQPDLWVEECGSCHSDVAEHYRTSAHAGKNLPCASCHEPAGPPTFARSAGDGACAGCHSSQFQQLQQSGHFRSRELLRLDGDRAARRALGSQGWRVEVDGRARFAGDAHAGAAGGRLCASCHLDDHRFSRAAVDSADSCTGCHADSDAHFPIVVPGFDNRCIACHVRVGETVAGQKVNSHRFARPGS